MKGIRGGFGPPDGALEILEEGGFILEQVGDVIENLHVVVKKADEWAKVSLGGGGQDLLINLSNFFCRHHFKHLLA
jgi:hypothetical protein